VPVYYDSETGTFAIASDHCTDCGESFYDTGCDAPGCRGFCCLDCGTGCDIEMDPDDGRCASALAAESEDDRDARVDAERAAFGLRPLRGDGDDQG